ncbi:MAG: NifB/NifX family molybdenum-iron cluster-binding protein [Chitinispirillaceae bacterium]|nr:NifB/NifX family molybdenum-iron cluster-binding protein [Chitinispirillaceae bacterium]
MKVAVTSRGNTLESEVDPRFGRCPYFLIVNSDDMTFKAVDNANISAGGGAGVQSGQLMAEHDAECVLTGNCGPNAFSTLNAAGIKVITGVDGIVRNAVEQYKKGLLAPTDEANVGSHAGMNRVGNP